MMYIFTIQDSNMHSHAAGHGYGAEKFLSHFCIVVTQSYFRNFGFKNQVRPPGKIQYYLCQSLIHWNKTTAIAVNTAFITNSRFKSFS